MIYNLLYYLFNYVFIYIPLAAYSCLYSLKLIYYCIILLYYYCIIHYQGADKAVDSAEP
jgi:hypothetical protein